MGKTPLQSIDDVFAVQSRNGLLEMRLEATRMEHYDSDSLEYDYFPEGISVYSYTAEGLLESVIVSDKAVHKSPKKENKTSDEVWEAYGNVVLHNVNNYLLFDSSLKDNFSKAWETPAEAKAFVKKFRLM